MPPAKPRAIDDSRSETSSSITNLKDKATATAMISSTAHKGKRNTSTVINGINQTSKALLPNGNIAATSEVDPNLPRTEWTKFPTAVLHSYRIAHRLPTSSSYTQPHASLIYQSSSTGLRAPSAILTRRRLHEYKHQRRKSDNSGQIKSKSGGHGITKDYDSRFKASQTHNHLEKMTIAQSIEGNDGSGISKSRTQLESDSHNAVRQPPQSLAIAVRKHFNAQQLNEADVVARFVYVVRQSTAQIPSVKTEGSDGDGNGWCIGSQGREIRKGDGGEVGFRLRFRP